MSIRLSKSLGLLLIILLGFTMCKPKPKMKFSGRILDGQGNGVVEALVEVGESTARTDKAGNFVIGVQPSNRYVLNITKLGFGFASKIFRDTTSNVEVTLTPATVVEVDPNEDIVVQDEEPTITEPVSADLGTPSSPLDTLGFIINAKGKLVGFGAPEEIINTYNAAEEFTTEQEGATVEVPAGALVDPEEQNEGSWFFQGKKDGVVTASVSTVDIYSRDGMPGDFTIRLDQERTGFMETFGAVDVNFYRDGKPLQLRKGEKAKLTIPIDIVTRRALGEKLPPTIPLFVYNKKTGEWDFDGDNKGRLNKDRTAYVAEVSHFSVFNMDEAFGNAACFRFCAPDSFVADNVTMEVAVPGHVKPFFPFANDCSPGDCLAGSSQHYIARMQADSPIGIRLQDNAGNVRSTYVFIAGDLSTPEFPLCPYSSCTAGGNTINLQFDECWMNSATPGTMTGPILALERDGTTDNFAFSWVYIDPGATISATVPYVTNPSGIEYKLQYIAPVDTSPLDQTGASWTDIPLSAGVATSQEMLMSESIVISGISTTAPVFFRVAVRIGGTGTYETSTVFLLNDSGLDPGSMLGQDWDGATCQFVATTINI